MDVSIMTYAVALKKRIGELITERCEGCIVMHPSQRRHTCLMMSENEHIDIYFDVALDEVDENVVIRTMISEMDNRSLAVNRKREFIEKLNDAEWRTTTLKTEEWKKMLYEAVIRLYQLENTLE